ncbi:MAG TPA: response regulator [Candidatus Limnocylindria bacterium]|nr:response regulator [Candidatus Limnocylindria bacterium]
MNPERETPRVVTLPTGAVPIAEALRDLLVAGGTARRAPGGHISVAVAAAVRAAVEWLTDDGGPVRPPRLSDDDGVLELTFDQVAHAGVVAASEVLESADANLGPGANGNGTWVIRAPVLAERETFLMVEQGTLGLAVPWHAVVRVRLIPTEAIDSTARRHRYPVLAPYVEPVREFSERPAVLIGLGLKRGLLVADRLIWRMSAEKSTVAGAGPVPGLHRQVRSDEGESYWIVDPRHVLHPVAPPSLDELWVSSTVRREGKPHVAAPNAAPAPPKRSAAKAHTPPELFVLRPEDVEPVGEEAGVGATTEPASAPPDELAPARPEEPSRPRPTGSAFEHGTLDPCAIDPRAASTPTASSHAADFHAADADAAAPRRTDPSPVASAPGAREALVAEDSLTARIFLSRLLAQRGFRVHAVASAAELRRALTRQRWTLVCADIELPDERGTEFLRPLAEQAKSAGHSLVALVRDGADAEAARAAGITHALRKPFELEALDRLLSRAGIQERP